MEISNDNMGTGGSLLKQMQSGDAIVKKAGMGPETKQVEGLGNILQSFGNVLQDQMSSINQLQVEADQAKQTFAVGGDIELHNVIMASEKAGLALELAMQVRNKAIAAYQEISHMTV